MWSLNSSRRKLSPIFSHTILGLIWLAELNIWHIWIFCRNICNICSCTSSSMLVHLQISQGLSLDSQRNIHFQNFVQNAGAGNGEESPEIFMFALSDFSGYLSGISLFSIPIFLFRFLRIYIWSLLYLFRLWVPTLMVKLCLKWLMGRSDLICFIFSSYIWFTFCKTQVFYCIQNFCRGRFAKDLFRSLILLRF